MTVNLTPATAVVFTLFSLSFLGFFVAGGVFAANVEVPQAISNLGGVCFFLWWLPGLIALVARKGIECLQFTRFGSVAVVVACVLLIISSLLLFVSALLLTSGPVAPVSQRVGDIFLAAWWIFGVIGAAFCALTVIYGIAGPIIDDSE